MDKPMEKVYILHTVLGLLGFTIFTAILLSIYEISQ